MKHALLLFILILFSLPASSQSDTTSLKTGARNNYDQSPVKLLIYPVPVREGFFTIKCDKEITQVKITNIIGQSIYVQHFDEPINLVKVNLDKPGRGIYLCAVYLSDGRRLVQKIMVEAVK